MGSIPSFSGAILAGGQSSRMGMDKALCRYEGLAFWQCQWELLGTLGARERFVCGPRRPEFPEMLECVPDRERDRGPLAGLAAALAHAQEEIVLVIAVDMPRLLAADLREMHSQTTEEKGCVPYFEENGRRIYEPLAAYYPKLLLAAALTGLKADDLSLQGLLRRCAEEGLMFAWQIPEPARNRFRSINSPADLRAD